jgi:hypothetical protein
MLQEKTTLQTAVSPLFDPNAITQKMFFFFCPIAFVLLLGAARRDNASDLRPTLCVYDDPRGPKVEEVLEEHR